MPHDTRTPATLHPDTHTVPLWPIAQDGSCTCGATGCKSPGKHPRHGLVPLTGGGYGIFCGEINGIFVVDCDRKIKPSGEVVIGLNHWADLCRSHGHSIPETLTVATGGGGFHFYFRHPGNGKRIKNSTGKLAPCVDIKGENGWVVGPGSPHRSGVPYGVVHESAVAYAPPWLLEWAGLYADPQAPIDLATHGTPLFTPADPETDEGKRRMEAFRAECSGEVPSSIVPSIAGEGGDNKLFHAAKRGTTYWQLPADVAAAILIEHFNPRCQPPWDEPWIHRKCAQALATINEPTPGPPPEGWGDSLAKLALLGTTEPLEAPMTRPKGRSAEHAYDLIAGECVASGKLEKGLGTTAIVWLLCQHPRWAGVLYFDDFFGCIRAVDPPIKLDAEHGDDGISEADVGRIKIWFETVCGYSVTKDAMWDCIQLAARRITVHPIRDYFQGLPPGVPGMLRAMPSKLWGSTSELEGELFEKFLVGAVRRILNPGVQMDTVLILQGMQGAFKSKFVRTLFSDAWSSHQLPDITSKDGSQGLSGVWGQEIGEMDKFLRVDPRTSKDYISRTTDRYRPPYGRAFITRARQCVFIGTTNEAEFLRDATGERRYWIMRILREIDVQWIEDNRDLIWATALELAKDPSYEHWVREGTPQATKLAEIQTHFSSFDAWSSIVTEYLKGKDTVTTKDIFRMAIMCGGQGWQEKFTNAAAQRIASICTRLGCAPITEAGAKVWRVPFGLKNERPSPAELQGRAAMGEALIKLAK